MTFTDLLASDGRAFSNLYVITSESAKNYGQLQGLYSSAYYDSLVSNLRNSANFRLIYDSKNAQLFKLQPAPSAPAGA